MQQRKSDLLLALLRAAAAGAVAIGLASAATAQVSSGDAEEAEGQDTIVVVAPGFVPEGAVTATKTDTPLIETPQSVSVITRDQIDLLNFIDVQQAVRYTAGIVGENYGPDLRFDFLTLRGFIPVQYIDGIQAPVSATIANVGAELYGFQSVDVLKGPSAVLYGTTPPGGIYNLTSRRPSSQLEGEVQAKYGTDEFMQIAGTVTGGLARGVSARLTGLYRNREAQTDFVEAERAFAAPAVTVAVGPDTTLTGLGYYQYDRVRGETNGFLPVSGTLEPNPLGRIRRGTNLGEPDYNDYERRQFSAGYELVHSFGKDARFTQNARWSEYHEDMQTIFATGLAPDNRTVLRSNFPFRDDVQQFAVDSRFDGKLSTGAVEHRLLAGLDYRNYREESAFGFAAAPSIDLFEPVYGRFTPTVSAFFPFTDQRLKQTGIYLQDQARLGDFLVTLSGRQDWVSIKNGRVAGAPTSQQDRFSYRIGASYITDLGLAPYLSYSTSFEPVVGQDRDGRAFVPTTGKQIEAGVKYDGRTLSEDIRLFATAAVYQIRQTNVLTPDPDQTRFPGSNVQTGEAKVEGLELEVVTRIRDRLSFNGSYTYADARVTQSNVPGQVGARLFAQPRHKASLFLDYTVTDGRLAGLGAGAGIRHLSDSPGALPGPFTPVVYFTGGSTLFDAILRYDTADWRFAINGTNIFDKRYVARCTGPVGCFFGPSRQVIATVTRKF